MISAFTTLLLQCCCLCSVFPSQHPTFTWTLWFWHFAYSRCDSPAFFCHPCLILNRKTFILLNKICTGVIASCSGSLCYFFFFLCWRYKHKAGTRSKDTDVFSLRARILQHFNISTVYTFSAILKEGKKDSVEPSSIFTTVQCNLLKQLSALVVEIHNMVNKTLPWLLNISFQNHHH